MRRDNSTLAYTAGIMDGEGCISITCNKKKSSRKGIEYRIRVNVANTNEWLVNWLKFNFGGCVTKARPRENCKQMYQWVLSSKAPLIF
ncbi:MAG: LAGLIDADG family homing endonuclease [Dehalococcoidia bacterium]|nr:LAGLIDADG family homing endonuclease [Dehalococcoidia bacterium]